MNQHAIGFGYTPKATESIPQFCSSHNISRTHLYELIKQGKGPRLMKVGRRTLISQEAAAATIAAAAAKVASRRDETPVGSAPRLPSLDTIALIVLSLRGRPGEDRRRQAAAARARDGRAHHDDARTPRQCGGRKRGHPVIPVHGGRRRDG